MFQVNWQFFGLDFLIPKTIVYFVSDLFVRKNLKLIAFPTVCDEGVYFKKLPKPHYGMNIGQIWGSDFDSACL